MSLSILGKRSAEEQAKLNHSYELRRIRMKNTLPEIAELIYEVDLARKRYTFFRDKKEKTEVELQIEEARKNEYDRLRKELSILRKEIQPDPRRDPEKIKANAEKKGKPGSLEREQHNKHNAELRKSRIAAEPPELTELMRKMEAAKKRYYISRDKKEKTPEELVIEETRKNEYDQINAELKALRKHLRTINKSGQDREFAASAASVAYEGNSYNPEFYSDIGSDDEQDDDLVGYEYDIGLEQDGGKKTRKYRSRKSRKRSRNSHKRS